MQGWPIAELNVSSQTWNLKNIPSHDLRPVQCLNASKLCKKGIENVHSDNANYKIKQKYRIKSVFKVALFVNNPVVLCGCSHRKLKDNSENLNVSCNRYIKYIR